MPDGIVSDFEMLSSGDVTLTLHAALCSKGQGCDLVIETTIQDDVWRATATAIAKSFNSMVHDVILNVDAASGQIQVSAEIISDPWVMGGPLRVMVNLVREGNCWNGSYTGTFKD
ncbi:MAG: hypothetical protein WCJ56_14705, partial [bacterium]